MAKRRPISAPEASAITGASRCGNELIGYHDGRGPGSDGKHKGEDEQKLDHGRASTLPLHPSWQRRFESTPLTACTMMGHNVTILCSRAMLLRYSILYRIRFYGDLDT